MISGLDISNHQGELSVNWFRARLAEGWQHFIIRGGLERQAFRDLARRQAINAMDAGGTIDFYHWIYFSADNPVRLAQDAVATFGDLDRGIHWLDIEDPGYVLSPVENVQWLHRCVQEFELADRQVGIYTGRWFWVPYMGNSREFTHLALWTADYDGVPDLRVWRRYGGWELVVGKQYGDTGGLDRDVFDEVLLFARDGEDPVKIAELEAQVADLQNQVQAQTQQLAEKDSWIGALSHDVIFKSRQDLEAAVLEPDVIVRVQQVADYLKDYEA